MRCETREFKGRKAVAYVEAQRSCLTAVLGCLLGVRPLSFPQLATHIIQYYSQAIRCEARCFYLRLHNDWIV